MDFLKKAKGAIKDANDLNDGLKKLGFKPPSFGGDNKTSSQGSAPATPATTSVAPTSPPPMDTPTSSTMSIPQVTPSDSVPLCTADGAPKKLSLAVRKSIRDQYENNKAEHEAKLTQLLGVPWIIAVDTAGVFSYSVHQTSAQQSPGAVINEYMRGAAWQVERYVEKFGADGVNELNRLASEHTVTLEPTTDKAINYGYCAITGGKLRVLFRETQLGVNNTYACEEIGEVVNKAGKASGGEAGISMEARNGIQKDYDAKIEELQARISKTLQAPIVFEPNWEANYAAMLAFEKTLDMEDQDDRREIRDDWASRLGAATFDYFDGLASRLRDKNFHKDEMLREAFNESIATNTVSFKIVDKVSRTYNDCVIEDEKLVLRTIPKYFWTNANDISEQLMDLL